MISQLKGIIIDKQAPHVVVDCRGVGYEVQAPMTTFYALPAAGSEVVLFTHLSVREDAHSLYGFSDKEQRVLFRELIKVNGVGPKLALAILSSMTPIEFVAHVRDSDVTGLVKLPGVGKKTAERLIVEMGDRLKEWLSDTADKAGTASVPMASGEEASKEAISALIALGYKPQEASKAISKVRSEGLGSEALIKLALRGMM